MLFKKPLAAVLPIAILCIIPVFLAACDALTGMPAGEEAAGTATPAPASDVVDGVPAYMIKGDPSAPVTLVEWSDYQCPYCSQHFREASPQIDAAYVDDGQVRVIFRDFPLVSIHPQAVKAAEAARCAGDLGGSEAYWGMHDKLFETQDSWSGQDTAAEHFKSLAAELELDAAAFGTCLDEGKFADAVMADLEAGQAEGVSATPSFQLAGALLQGALPFEEFKTSLDTVVAGGELPTAPPPTATPEMVEVDSPTYDFEIGDAPVLGAADAPVTIIEFSDFQCPYCAQFASETHPSLKKDYLDTGRVRLVWMDFPLNQIHPQAAAASEAARCARDQGGDEAFWAMHDALFASQEEWSGQEDPAPIFSRLADENDLDGAALAACLKAETHKAAVAASVDKIAALGVNGTPSFLLNGYLRAGVPSPEGLGQVIQVLEQGETLKMMVPKDVAASLESGTPLAPDATATPADVDIAGAPVKGDADAPVTIVEFSDFECPYCGTYTAETYPDLVKQFVDTGKVKYVFRDFPLSQIHPQAAKAAEAARCARDQGGDDAFWTMHDALFASQGTWAGQTTAADTFADLADEAALDRAAFTTCLDSGKHADAVQADFDAGVGYGVQGTPSFFINGQMLSGALPLAEFETAIEAAIKAQADTTQ
jgi:protein-disulfide isomerase